MSNIKEVVERTSYDPTYPNVPGFRRAGTSEAAARTIAPFAKDIRGKLLEVFKEQVGGLTTDEAARRLQMEPWKARPRVSELVRLGEIRDSGKTRPGESGINCTVWIPSGRPLPRPWRAAK